MPVAAEVSQTTNTNGSVGLDDSMLDDVASAVAQNSVGGGMQLASFNLNFNSGQSLGMSVSQLPTGSFRLDFSNLPSVPMSNATTIDSWGSLFDGSNLSAGSALGSMLGSSMGSGLSSSVDAGASGSASLNLSGLANAAGWKTFDVTNSFLPTGTMSNITSALSGLGSSNIAAPMINSLGASLGSSLSTLGSSGMVGSALNGSLSTGPWLGSLWPNGVSSGLTSGLNSNLSNLGNTSLGNNSSLGWQLTSPSDTLSPESTLSKFDLSRMDQTSVDATAPMIGSSTSLGSNLGSSFGGLNLTGSSNSSWSTPTWSSGLNSGGWMLTGTHSPVDPTAADLYFRSRA
jgi:hypothetical protein